MSNKWLRKLLTFMEQKERDLTQSYDIIPYNDSK